MPLVIYGLGGGHTHTHTLEHTHIHIRMKVISRNQACSRHASGLIITLCFACPLLKMNTMDTFLKDTLIKGHDAFKLSIKDKFCDFYRITIILFISDRGQPLYNSEN